MRSTFTALLCKLKRLISHSRPSKYIYSKQITRIHYSMCVCLCVCVSVCKSQWLLNLICQQINGRSQLAAATSRLGESFSTQNTFQISSSHLLLLLLLRLLLFFFFQRELLDLTPAWISSSFSLEKTISLFISGQRPINQFFSSRLSKQKKSRKRIPHKESIKFFILH